jgi:hypothetical protein
MVKTFPANTTGIPDCYTVNDFYDEVLALFDGIQSGTTSEDEVRHMTDCITEVREW